jgi:PAS domain S-box-containing protein
MTPVLTLLFQRRYIDVPASLGEKLLALFVWLALLAVIISLLRRWRSFEKPRTPRYWWLLLAFAVLTPLTSLFVAVRLAPGTSLSQPSMPVEQVGALVALFSAVPWVLAAGFLGPGAATGLAAASGVLLAVWETHNPFLPLEMALLAVLFSAAVHQRYRTPAYQLLRQPLIASLVVSTLHPLLYFIFQLLILQDSLAVRLDYAITQVGPSSLAAGVQLALAGLIGQLAVLAWPLAWGNHGPLQPSPVEKSLQTRMLYSTTPVLVLLLLTLIIADWFTAGNAAQSVLRDRMADAAANASQGVPYFQSVGQSQIASIAADPRLYSATPADIRQILRDARQQTAFFTQLYVINSQGNPVTGYPQEVYDLSKAFPEEQVGLRTALSGGLDFQMFIAPLQPDARAAQVSFIATILDANQQPRGVLIGRTDLETNLFSIPILNSLHSIASQGGEGILIDEKGRILYHQNPELLMSEYSGRTVEQAEFFDQAAPDGTRSWVYYYPGPSSPWDIVLSIPARQVQGIALEIALPLFLMLLAAALLVYIVLRVSLNVVTGSLRSLAYQAGRLAQGQLEEAIPSGGEDETGQLKVALERMRASLKGRMDELNRLLVVSQGVASSLELADAIRPVLESALAMGASMARIVVVPAVVPELEGDALKPQVYSLGSGRDLYHDLDEQVMGLARQQERLVLSNVSRPRILRFSTGAPRPTALMAAALRHENQFFGCLLVVYDQAHAFSEEEVRFMMTLASQAALAAANAQLFLNAEIGRQRLAAILASTPDPVLVTDQQNRLLLANPAAWKVLGLGIDWEEGQPIQKVVSHPALLHLLTSGDEKPSAEIVLGDERVFYATASSVQAEGHRVGRVCVLRDITNFKALDALKSEFVATVSHDLRSPLTLMRGYASMLENVGELNEQQQGYVRKIISSVESMARLVSNLLDLGRIETGIGLQLEKISVYDIIEKVVGALQLEATQKRVHLGAFIPEQTIPLLEADQALLQQALHNLVENAIKYTDSGGKVQVRVSASQNRMLFIVNDTGIGISPVDQPRLFEKFYRGAQQGSKHRPGVGLGLTIVRSIADRHGGKVWVESQLGKGSTFYLEIPLSHSVAEAA